MLCTKSVTCSAQLSEKLTVRKSHKQKQTMAKAAGLGTPFKVLESNFRQFAVNLPWQSFDTLITFKMTAFINFEAVPEELTDFCLQPYCRPS